MLPAESTAKKIYNIHDHKVLLHRNMAELYGVETKILKQAARRNTKRFPEDLMFILSIQEVINLSSQILASSGGGSRYLSMAFTEQGVAMLSCVLKSGRAVNGRLAFELDKKALILPILLHQLFFI